MVKSVVAIPVRDEADRITGCLTALNAQTHQVDVVVLLLDACRDDTEMIVRALAPTMRFQLEVVVHSPSRPSGGAGHARKLAMAMAANHAGETGVLLTTDADAVVSADWLQRNLQALNQGADVVCGRATIDPEEARAIPRHLHDDDAREYCLITLLDRLAWALDPELHDPIPRHTEASGASLAIRADIFRQVGGVPPIRAGEDRALVRAVWMMDGRVRHDPAIQVRVSGRIVGRAEGGMADAIRRRIERQDEFADDQVEPATDAFRRYSLRYRARCAWLGASDAALASDLGLPPKCLEAGMNHRFFGSAWAVLEGHSAVLRRRRVRFVDLAAETRIAEALLRDFDVPEILAAD